MTKCLKEQFIVDRTATIEEDASNEEELELLTEEEKRKTRCRSVYELKEVDE